MAKLHVHRAWGASPEQLLEEVMRHLRDAARGGLAPVLTPVRLWDDWGCPTS